MSFTKHWSTVRLTADDTLEWYLRFLADAHPSLRLEPAQMTLVQSIYEQAWQQYVEASKTAFDLSKRSALGTYANVQRSPHFNPEVSAVYQAIRSCYVDKGFISVLGGITLVRQTGSLKYVYIDQQTSEPVLDMMGSATTLNIGAGFPLFAAVDAIESMLGINENFALVYHASVHQQRCFDHLRSLYPNQSAEPQVFSESSGTAVNSISIEASSAYAEKLGLSAESKLLAFQGTWSGGFGTAKEASSFGASDQIAKKAGLRWVDRCLPIPRTREEEKNALETIKQRIQSGTASGVIFEKIIGDAGIIELPDGFVTHLVKLFADAPAGALPIIVDEIQAGNGRSANTYWSFGKHAALMAYDKLIITNAKSAGGGKPYAYALIPKAIAESAYPLSMLTTHSGNGPLGRAVVYAKFITHEQIQAIKHKTSESITRALDDNSVKWRGRHLNIGILANDGEELELLQHYLYINYGILTGSFPATLRFQPNMIEYPGTLVNTARTIARAMHEISNTHGEPMARIRQKVAGNRGGLNL